MPGSPSRRGVRNPFSQADNGANLFTKINALDYLRGDGSPESSGRVAALVAALPSSSSRAIYFPGGRTYNLPTGLPIIGGGSLRIFGDGQLASKIVFSSGTGIVVQPNPLQSTADFVQVDGLSIEGNSATTKTCLKIIAPANGTVLRELRLVAIGNNDDTALACEGWDQISVQDCWFEASKNIVASNVTVGTLIGTGQFDHVNFHNLSLYSPTSLYPLISLGTTSISKASFTGRQAWVGGAGGLVIPNTVTSVNGLSVDGARMEPSVAGASGYMIDIQPALARDILIRGTSGAGSSINGHRYRNTQRVNWTDVSFGNDHVGEVALDFDNTCDKLHVDGSNLINGANSQRIIGDQLMWHFAYDLFNTSGTPFYSKGYLAKRNASGVDYESQKLYGVNVWADFRDATVPLANGAQINLPRPAVVGPYILGISFYDGGATGGSGSFGLYPIPGADKIGGTANCVVGAPGAGSVGVFNDAGANCYVKNNTGGSIRIVLKLN